MEKRLVDLSGLKDPLLKNETIKYIRKNGVKRPIEKLVQLLNHPCSQEQIEKINIQFQRKYYSLDDSDVDVGSGKKLKDVVLDTMSHDSAQIIGEGFDIAFKDNLNINSVTGAVTVKRDASGKPDPRFEKCTSAEISLEMPKGSESDPYKGSLQGFGRTRKHKRRAKKTLRRRKMRRNMH